MQCLLLALAMMTRCLVAMHDVGPCTIHARAPRAHHSGLLQLFSSAVSIFVERETDRSDKDARSI